MGDRPKVAQIHSSGVIWHVIDHVDDHALLAVAGGVAGVVKSDMGWVCFPPLKPSGPYSILKLIHHLWST